MALIDKKEIRQGIAEQERIAADHHEELQRILHLTLEEIEAGNPFFIERRSVRRNVHTPGRDDRSDEDPVAMRTLAMRWGLLMTQSKASGEGPGCTLGRRQGCQALPAEL